MRAEFEVNGRVRAVSIERRGQEWQVTLDGVALDVDVASLGGGGYSLRLPAHGTQHDVVVSVGRDNGDVEVVVSGAPVQLRRRTPGLSSRHAGHGAGDGPQRVVAPMPGKVVRVLVAPGDDVRARQGVVVVEAMKMENELRAARPGIVRDVLVVEGASVETGTPLVVIE